MLGDKNTKFFHSSTIVRRRRNKIDALMNEEGDWVFENEALKDLAVRFYVKLFIEEVGSYKWVRGDNNFPPLEVGEKSLLSASVFDDEIRRVVFEMGDLKAPVDDGLQAFFFKSQWGVLGRDVCEYVRSIFENPWKVAEVNHTLLVLVPKVENLSLIKDFRPISLCNVIYRAVTKVVANRLRA